ncbi:MAG: hypothetical protein ACE5GB_08930 [Acidimicrobiales bacterium]
MTPGCWRRPDLTAAAFDDGGFLAMGDAGRLADVDDPSAGIVLDGRIAENFKLASGTWVHVGELRVALLVFPDLAACRSEVPGADEAAPCVNQRAVLDRRADLVERLHGAGGPDVLLV